MPRKKKNQTDVEKLVMGDLLADKSSTWLKLAFEERAARLRRGEEPRELWEAARERLPLMNEAEIMAAFRALAIPRDIWIEAAQGIAEQFANLVTPAIQKLAADLFAIVKPAQVLSFQKADELMRGLGEPSQQIREMLDEFLRNIQALKEEPPTTEPGGIEGPIITPVIVPDRIPQKTWYEASKATEALADGATGRHWQEVPGELALYHSQPDDPVQIKLVWVPQLTQWGHPEHRDSLYAELQRLDSTAVLLFHYMLHLSFEHERVTVEIDELVKALGLSDQAKRSKLARIEVRRRIWRTMCFFEGLRSIGKRPGKGNWRDKYTNKLIPVVDVDRFIHLGRQTRPEQMAFDESEPPIEVTFWPGQFIAENRHNVKLFSHFGELRRLAEIPAGKPAGNWARGIGLALQQWWREQSKWAEVKYSGESNKLTVRYRYAVTRRELLDRYTFEPHYRDILDGPNPQRAIEYWNKAIKILKKIRLLGYSAELSKLEVGRKEWKEPWLDQLHDMRPADDDLKHSAEIAKKAEAQRKRAKRGRPKRKNERKTVGM